MAEVYSIGAAALAAGKELGATIESAAEKRDKAFQDFDVKYNLTSTMEETVSDTLQPVYRQAAQAALDEAQEAATALEADPNNADLRARVRAAQRQYDEIKNIGVARTAQDNKTRQMIRNGEIEDMAGSIEENLAKMDEMSSMNGKTITMDGGTVMITNPDGSKTPVLSSAYGDVQAVFAPAVKSPASKYNPSLIGSNMNWNKYLEGDGRGFTGVSERNMRDGFPEDLDVLRRANPNAYRTAVAQNYLVQTTGETDISKQALDAEVARIEPLIESTSFEVNGKQVAATTYSLDEDGKVVYDLTNGDIEKLFSDKQISKDDMDALMHYRKANSMYIEDTYQAEVRAVDTVKLEQQRRQNIQTKVDSDAAYNRSRQDALADALAESNLPNLNFTNNNDGTHSVDGLTRTRVVIPQDIVDEVPALGTLMGGADDKPIAVVGGKLDDSTGRFVSVKMPAPDGFGGPHLEVDQEFIAAEIAKSRGSGSAGDYMGEAQEILNRLGAAINNSSDPKSFAKGQTLDIIEGSFRSALGTPPSQEESGVNNSQQVPDTTQFNPTRE